MRGTGDDGPGCESDLMLDSLRASDVASAIVALPIEYLRRQRWFGDKSRRVTGVLARDVAIMPLENDRQAALALIDVTFDEGEPATYFMPLILGLDGSAMARENDSTVVTRFSLPSGQVTVGDALSDPEFCTAAHVLIGRGGHLRATTGRFVGTRTDAFIGEVPARSVRLLGVEQSNTSVVFDRMTILKSFRRIQPGTTPDLEIARFLTARTDFRHVPLLAGDVEYQATDGYTTSIAMLQHFVANQGDGWEYTLAHLRAFYGLVAEELAVRPAASPLDRVSRARLATESYLHDARRLGGITGHLHRSLSSAPDDPAFAPEPVVAADLNRWSANVGEQLDQALRVLERTRGDLDVELQTVADVVLGNQARLRQVIDNIDDLAGVPMSKIRHHGDYHLGQVLKTADGFIILDFEGEPARPLAERRLKHTPLRDVAGMLRSFDYALHAGLRAYTATGDSVDRTSLLRWGRVWQQLVDEAFLAGYTEEARRSVASFLPSSRSAIDRVIAIFTLEKAAYELMYELNNRPDWVGIPLTYLADYVDKRNSRV
ncbi:MAG TPA: putative maltokinase [Chloroflexota bacterium]|nr:putative maltokinase [Chloroflexota bacterium]